MLRVRLLVALTVAVAPMAGGLAPGVARAQMDLVENDPGAGWAEVLHPERRQGRYYLRDGLALLVRALSESRSAGLGDAPTWVVLEGALLRFTRAAELLPGDREVAYYTAYALTRWERVGSGGGIEHRIDEAIDAWRRVRALDEDFLPNQVAYQLAMLHMRRSELREARAEYEAALRHAVPAPVRLLGRFYLPFEAEDTLAFLHASVDEGNLRGNLAEVTMLLGEPREAQVHYRAAIEQAQDPVTRSLARWGLALALDRGGDHEGALETVAAALREDATVGIPRYERLHEAHGAFTILHLEHVFFEPAYELHAYEALGHEALGRAPGASPPEHLARAIRSWRLFLAEGGTTSIFASIARAHLERLEGAPSSPPSGRAPRR